jgi:acetoacetate decarboxylase
MFTFDPNDSYTMPAHFGQRPVSPKSSGWYRDVTSISVPFLTDPDVLSAYLPALFKVAENPVVTVTYTCNRNVDWLAGHGYNIIAVNAAADFEGADEQLAGNYCLVMWENLADPIIRGRELQGIPKIYADIPTHSEVAGRWQASASHFGHKIVDISIEDLRDPTPSEVVAASEAAAHRDNPMALRYLPGVSGVGQSLKQATTYPSETTIQEAWVGKGRVDWQSLCWEQNPTQFHIVNALAGLPVLEWLPSVVAKGSTNLTLPERMTREIN